MAAALLALQEANDRALAVRVSLTMDFDRLDAALVHATTTLRDIRQRIMDTNHADYGKCLDALAAICNRAGDELEEIANIARGGK